MSKASIMIVEDKFIVAQDIAMSLRKLGYTVAGIAASGLEAIEKAGATHPSLILMDIHLKGDMDGIDAAAKLQGELNIPIVYLTAHSDEATLERASATQPCGFLLKPYDERQLYSTIELALNRSRMQKNDFLKANPDVLSHSDEVTQKDASPGMAPVIEGIRTQPEFANIIGGCARMLQLLHNVELVAKTDVTVHIYGENGTGKELIAEALHQLSPRHKKAFIKLNCSAIPNTLLESALFGHSKGAFTGASKEQEGFIERAEGGTLFLDEIGDVSQDIQVKLLRILQNREYTRVGETAIHKADIRIITATNRDLKELVQQGKVREDFFYRIHVFPLEVPPLRERGNDILAIAEHFRALFNKLHSKNVAAFSDDAKAALLAYRWPGNVRELENAIRRAFVLVSGERIELDHLPADLLEGVAKIAREDRLRSSDNSESGSNSNGEQGDKILETAGHPEGNGKLAADAWLKAGPLASKVQ